jgi:hypothetical protein
VFGASSSSASRCSVCGGAAPKVETSVSRSSESTWRSWGCSPDGFGSSAGSGGGVATSVRVEEEGWSAGGAVGGAELRVVRGNDGRKEEEKEEEGAHAASGEGSSTQDCVEACEIELSGCVEASSDCGGAAF